MMTFPALVLVFAAAAPQKAQVGLVSVEKGPLAADADHLRTQDRPSPGGNATPSSFLERSDLYAEGEAACTLSPRYVSAELVAAVEEDMCTSISKAHECVAVEACDWLPVRKRSFLEHALRKPAKAFSVGTVRLTMKKYCQAKDPITVDQLTAAGVADKAEADGICRGLSPDAGKDRGMEDRCKRNILCRYGCFPPECGCFMNEKGYNKGGSQEVCDQFMHDELGCEHNQGCSYMHSGNFMGIPISTLLLGLALVGVCGGGGCFYCIAVLHCCTPRKKHHHAHHHAPAHAEQAEEEEEWEEG